MSHQKDLRKIDTAIITGPTGVVGGALCSFLSQKGIKTYAVVRPESIRVDHLLNIPGVHAVVCDAAEYNSLPELIGEKADAFFHLAWRNTIGEGRNDMPAQIDNIRETIMACMAAKSLGCEVFVGAGSQAEYGRHETALRPDTPCFPENGYGMAKLCAGQMSRLECNKLGIDHIWPRILSVYGPYDGEHSMITNVIRQMIAGEIPLMTAGEQYWDYLYSEDAAEALYALACRGINGSIYPLGSGSARPLREYVEIIRDEIDPAMQIGFGKIPYVQQQVMYLEADISDLERDTGFKPRTDFRTGIQKTINWVRDGRR